MMQTSDENRDFRVSFIAWLLVSATFGAYVATQSSLSAGERFFALLIGLLLLALYILQTSARIRARFADLAESPFTRVAGILALFLVLSTAYSLAVHKFTFSAMTNAFLLLLIPLGLAVVAGKRETGLTLPDILIILAIWFPIEFGWTPDLPIPPSHGILNFYHLQAIILAIYIFTNLRPIPDMGLQVGLLLRDAGFAVKMTLIFMVVFALPIGLPTGFIAFNVKQAAAAEYIAGIVGTAFLIALPEEILFRGIIQKLIEKHLPEKKHIALILASIVFGLSHGNNNDPPFLELSLGFLGAFSIPWVYIVLATIAGWFYGKTYQRTGNLAAAALVHTLVDCIWWLFFSIA